MIKNSIASFINPAQDAQWKFELERFKASEGVFCPMCEISHMNNTLCQMPANNFDQGVI